MYFQGAASKCIVNAPPYLNSGTCNTSCSDLPLFFNLEGEPVTQVETTDCR